MHASCLSSRHFSFQCWEWCMSHVAAMLINMPFSKKYFIFNRKCTRLKDTPHRKLTKFQMRVANRQSLQQLLKIMKAHLTEIGGERQYAYRLWILQTECNTEQRWDGKLCLDLEPRTLKIQCAKILNFGYFSSCRKLHRWRFLKTQGSVQLSQSITRNGTKFKLA